MLTDSNSLQGPQRQGHESVSLPPDSPHHAVIATPSAPDRANFLQRLRGLEGAVRRLSYEAEPGAIAHDTRACAGFAVAGLRAYARRTRAQDELPSTLLTHLLCDLMHLSDLVGA